MNHDECLKADDFSRLESLIIKKQKPSLGLDLGVLITVFSHESDYFPCKQISFSSPFSCFTSLSSLEYLGSNNDGRELIQLLRHCPFLQSLSVSMLAFSHYDLSLDLNHLRDLKLVNVEDFFTNFPVKIFPRLATLCFVYERLDIALITQKCPVLDVLSAIDCHIENSFNKEVLTVRRLDVVYYADPAFQGPINLKQFVSVKHLGFFVEDSDKSVLLPPSLSSLRLGTRLRTVKDELLRLSPCCAITGVVYVTKEEHEGAKVFVEHLSEMRSRVWSNIELKLMNSTSS
ncbi:hypothetical protein RCL1_008333 [Eukaryota sp. TZLM3-RCL]